MTRGYDYTKCDDKLHVPEFVQAMEKCGVAALQRLKKEGMVEEGGDLCLYLRSDTERMTIWLRIFSLSDKKQYLEIAWYCFDENGMATYETEDCWRENHKIPLVPNAPSYWDEEWMMRRCVTVENVWRSTGISGFTEYRAKQVAMLERAERAIRNGQKTDEDGYFEPDMKLMSQGLK